MIDRLAEGLDIRLNSHVTKVSYGAQPSITLKDGTEVFGSAVIVTVPLGVLQRGYIAFDPPLPKPKDEAIKRIGFGALDKVALLFERPPWKQGEEPPHLFGAISPSERGMFFLFINGTDMASGRPLILALTSGKVPKEHCRKYNDTGHRLPLRWRQCPTTRSSAGRWLSFAAFSEPTCPIPWAWRFHDGERTSMPTVRTLPSRQAARATTMTFTPSPLETSRPIPFFKNKKKVIINACCRLHFAGEATNRYYPATVHGAMLSGYREAASILNVYKPVQVFFFF